MKRIQKLWFASGLVVLVAAGLVAVSVAGAKPRNTCAPARNVEAMIDDSGSMAISDPNRLRVQGMDLLIDTLGNSTYLGVVEFGSAFGEGYVIPPAFTIFPPEPVGPNAASMQAALDRNMQADHGDTDYTGAFAQADADNPTADARIFLTEGAHNVGTYNEAHLAHNVPTYVIGLGIVAGEDQARLQKIAGDTRGRYSPLEDSSELQPAFNKVGAALTCKTPPRQFVDNLKRGQSKARSVGISRRTRTVQITITWSNPLDRFKIYGLRIVSGHRARAMALTSGRRRTRKPKVSRKTGATFTVLNVSRLRKGELRFKVRATKLGSGVSRPALTTQVSQTRK